MIGSTGYTSNVNKVFCNRISCSKRTSIVYKTEASEITPKDIINVFEQDFNDVREQPSLSREDKQFLCQSITDDGGQFMTPHNG